MRGAVYVFIGFLFVPAACCLASENLLPNGDFSSANQLAGWSCSSTPGSSTSWNSDDAGSSASSGSMQVSAVGYYDPISMMDQFGIAFCSSPCLAVPAGAAYRYGGQSKVTAAGAESIGFLCIAHTTSDCNDNGPLLSAPVMSATTSWNTEPATAQGDLPAATLAVTCTASDFDLLGSTARFDNLFFTIDTIFASGFEQQ
jgi:hypothetical protein